MGFRSPSENAQTLSRRVVASGEPDDDAASSLEVLAPTASPRTEQWP
jgi:hypothetical protein